ncbi:MAG: sigma-70 family RNA polymerase sigma factor [Pseudomonadota bacterium]
MTPAEQQFRAELVNLLPRLRRFARALARHREDADDLVQAALERALTRREQWAPGTRLDSWMFKIINNAWIDEVRSRARRDALFAPEEQGEGVGAPQADSPVDAIAVRRAIAQLNDDQRAAVGLVLVEGLPYKEAAAVLDVPIGTLTSRLARAREQLQAALADPAGGAEAAR